MSQVIKNILTRNLLQLFYERDKCGGRRSFVAVIRQGGWRVVRPRKLQCCDIVLFETTLTPDEDVSKAIVSQSVTKYIEYEMQYNRLPSAGDIQQVHLVGKDITLAIKGISLSPTRPPS